MNTQQVSIRRLLRLAAAAGIWDNLAGAVYVSLVKGMTASISSIVMALALALLVTNRRLIERLEARPITRMHMGVFAVVALFGGMLNWWGISTKSLFILGELYVPTLVHDLGSIGTVILCAALFWESLRLGLRLGDGSAR